MKRNVIWPIIAVTLVLAACSSSAPTQAVEITLEVANMRYQPATIEATAGQPVKLRFRNNDSVDHDFSILEIPLVSMGPTQAPMAGHAMGDMAGAPQLHLAARLGQHVTLEFTPTKPGTYEFYCTVSGHKEAGMHGRLIVK